MKIRTALAAAALSALLLAPITAAHADDVIEPTDPAVVETTEPTDEAVLTEQPAVELPAIDEPLTAAEQAVGDEPLAAFVETYTKPSTGHDPVTFCHKPGTPASQELTTDDDGFLQGHLGHGDTLGACPPVDEPVEEPVIAPTCTVPNRSAVIYGDGVFTVPGGWESVSIAVPYTGTLAGIGTTLEINADPLPFVGLHIDTALGSIVFEEEPSYAGKLWSNVSWAGVDAGMGYAAFGSIEQYIAVNGNVPVTGVRLLYTNPAAASSTVSSFIIGCTGYTFAPEPTEEPTEEPTPTETPTVTPTPPTETPTAVVVPTETPTVTQIGTTATPTTLAATGAGTAAGLATVIALLAAGTGALLLARRRRTATV